MPRNLKKNRYIYSHPDAITGPATTADIAITGVLASTFLVTAPSMPQGVLITDWGIVQTTARVGDTGYILTLQKNGGTTAVADSIALGSFAVNVEGTASGNGVLINAGDTIKMACTITGTASTPPVFAVYIGFSL